MKRLVSTVILIAILLGSSVLSKGENYFEPSEVFNSSFVEKLSTATDDQVAVYAALWTIRQIDIDMRSEELITFLDVEGAPYRIEIKHLTTPEEGMIKDAVLIWFSNLLFLRLLTDPYLCDDTAIRETLPYGEVLLHEEKEDDVLSKEIKAVELHVYGPFWLPDIADIQPPTGSEYWFRQGITIDIERTVEMGPRIRELTEQIQEVP